MRISDWSSDVCSSDLIKDQALIGNAAARLCDGGIQTDVQADLTQFDAFAIQPRLFRHDEESDIFLRLKADDTGVGFQPLALGRDDGVRYILELTRDFQLPFWQWLARAVIKGQPFPAP